MTEKGDGTPDTVSLPPTYAPSEAYTESPPPAYRGGRVGGGKVVQVVRLVCVTAVVLALLCGFFVLSSNYLKTRACTCEPRPLDTPEARAALLHAGFLQPPPPPSAQALVEEKKEEEIKENSLDLGDDTVLGEDALNENVLGEDVPPTDQVDALVEEVVEAEQQLEEEMKQVVEEEESALQDILSAQADHMKKIRLPVDLILGNPNLAGREVNCEVERRQVPVAPGVLSQTILVTCRDDDDDKDNTPLRPLGSAPRPPLSMLAPLMKMLTSRPGPQPRLVPVSLRGPVPLMQSRPVMQVPIRSPFPLPAKPRMSPVSVRGPMSPMSPMSPLSVVVPRPGPEEGPSDRMLPRHLQPVVRLTPRFLSAPREEPRPISLMGFQRGALPLPQARPRAPPRPISMSPPRPLPNFLPFNVLGDAEPRPATHMEMNHEPPRPAEDPTPPRMDFGPPRGHTLISDNPEEEPRSLPRAPPRLITLPKAIRVHTLPRDGLRPPSPMDMPRSFAPPPRFAPEARRSPISPEINPEAEIVAPPAPESDVAPPTAPQRKHHLLMVN